MIDFDKFNNRYGTYCTQWDFVSDRFGRNDLLPFTISDTDFEAPEEIQKAILKRCEHGIYGYTRWNHNDYKDAISYYFSHRKQVKIQKDWIVYSPTVLYTLAVLIQMITKKGSNILTFNPMYDAFIKVIENNGRTLIHTPLDYHNKNAIDFDDLENKLKTTSLFLLCSPHNPTGKIFTKSELDRIVSLCNRYRVWLISDEIHSDILLFNSAFTSIAAYMQSNEKLILVSSASKTFNTPGLGGSYALITNASIRECFLHISKDTLFTNQANIFGIEALIHGYKECDAYIDELNQYIEGNMEMIASFLKTYYPQIEFHMPQATYLAWINITNIPFSMSDIQKSLVKKGKVAIMDGTLYDFSNERYLRLNAGCSRIKLRKGLQRLKLALDSLML